MAIENPRNKIYRVVDILSPSRVVLNVGRFGGITDKSEFDIYNYGNEIVDPDTNEPLGLVFLPRGRGRVVVLQDKLCTIETKARRTPGLSTFVYTVGSNPAPFDQPQIGDFASLVTEENTDGPDRGSG